MARAAIGVWFFLVSLTSCNDAQLSSSTPTAPALPLYSVDTTFPDTTNYTVTQVPSGGDLQSAINNASCNPNGTVLRLASGATFSGNYTLPAKTCASGKWVIIRTDTADSNLPGQGMRIDPTYSSVSAKILSSNATGPIATASQANHYWFMGLEIGFTASVTLGYGAFVVGNAETSTSLLPSNIVVDRCYIHGNPTGNIRRGVEADGISVAVIDSYISDFHDTDADTQAVWAYNTPGPILIRNNELQASGENVAFGGADPAISGLVPSDITITKNHFFKPLAWFSGSPNYAGILWIVKNLLEFKNAQRVLVEGNVLENNWAQAQTGFAILSTPRNQNGTCTWCTVAGVTIRYNVLAHSGGGINIAGADSAPSSGGPSQPSQCLNIHDNLLYDINGPKWGGADGMAFQIANGGAIDTHDITINHNTAFQTGNIITTGDLAHATLGFAFENNISPHNAYGVIGTQYGVGNSTLTAYFPGAVFTNNVIENIQASAASVSQYPAGNFFPASWTAVAFVDSTNCPAGNLGSVSDVTICGLSSSSPYKDLGTDSKDIGADMARLASSVTGVAP